ncbi:MAG: hypothetical protein AAFP23_07140 [Pseudomonadota bacterium]
MIDRLSLIRFGGIAVVLLLAACTTPTPYQAAEDGRDGYASQKLTQDRWRVSFDGNSSTPRATVEDYLLFRAAEITKEQDAAQFRIVDRETEPQTRFVGSGLGVGAGFLFHRNTLGFGGVVNAQPITRYTAYMEIQVLSAEAVAGDPDVYEAEAVLSTLASRIVIKPPS